MNRLPNARSKSHRSRIAPGRERAGAMLVFTALLLVLIIVIAAMAIDIGGAMVTCTNLQPRPIPRSPEPVSLEKIGRRDSQRGPALCQRTCWS
ncbi:MAG: hypothetical protein R3B96_24025 [Pirellulaceae bacterium]